MKKKFIMFIILIAFLLIGLMDLIAREYMQMGTPIIIDSIRPSQSDPGRREWNVRFSKFRSIRWNDLEILEAEENGEEVQKENSQAWLSFFKVEEEEDSVLPPALPEKVYRHDRYFMIVKGKFDFKGNNWFIIEPAYTRNAASLNSSFGEQLGQNIPATEDEKFTKESNRYKRTPHYIQLDGVTLRVNAWIFGVARDYKIDLLFEEFDGTRHSIRGGNLEYLGWRKIGFDIPQDVVNRQKDLKGERDKPIKLLGFRVTTAPEAKIGKFYFAIDYITADTTTSEKFFHGKKAYEKIIDYVEE